MPYTHDDAMALWAESEITALDAGDLPQYGTRAWRELAPDDPKRAAAIITAAEQWRRHLIEERWLNWLGEADPEAWYAEVFQDARAESVKLVRAIRSMRTARELKAARATFGPVREVRASPGWPPVAVPGQPGRRRYLVNDRQVDRNSAPQENVA